MKYFVDRISEYINRKRLEVKNITYNENGEISEIIADVFRNEGKVTTEGTALNSHELNSILDSIYMIIDEVFRKLFVKIEDDLIVSWVREEELQSKTFRIDLLCKRFYAKTKINFPDYLLTVSVTNHEDYIEVKLDETSYLHIPRNTTLKIDFDIEFYTDENLTNYFTTLTGTLNYINTSTNPID